jgi:hypothetical protein
MQIDWAAVGQHSYYVESNGNLSTGHFQSINPQPIMVGGQGPTTSSYIISGGATNGIMFYRIRLGP